MRRKSRRRARGLVVRIMRWRWRPMPRQRPVSRKRRFGCLAESHIATAATPAVVLIRSVEPGDLIQPGRTMLVLARDGKTPK